MAGVPIRFRCFRCNQLLGVSRGKAGTVVNCPRCSAELIVPDPSEAPPGAMDPTIPATGPPAGPPTLSVVSPPPEPRAGSLDSGLALDFLDIRPEDIRVEAGVEESPVADLLGMSGVELGTAAGSHDDAVPAFSVVGLAGVAAGDLPAVPAPVPPPSGAEAPASPVGDVAPVVPPIRVDGPPRRTAARAPTVRPHDVVLPRSVVSTWSLLVLAAVSFAFLAGLLAGHFVWRVH